jgi:hypothetical protein
MEQASVRILVGRGDPSGPDIRAALEDEGFVAVDEASTVDALARSLQEDPPHVVVLDDTIGVVAAQAVAELAPDAKLIVLWPAGVLPIAGATRVDAADIDIALGPAVAAAAGVAAGGFTTIEPPAWIEAVRKDPATLREMLAQHGETPVRPSVTELQRPLAHRATTTGWRAKAKAAAPLSAAAGTVGTLSGAATDDEDAVVNRRLGMIALGGAVAAGALMIALSFGRATPSVVAAEPFVPRAGASSNFIPHPGGDTGDGSSSTGGQGGAPTLGGGQTGGTTTGSTTGGSGGGGGAGGSTGGAGTGTGGSGGGPGTGGPGGSTSTQGFGGATSPSNPGGRSTAGGGGGQGGGAGQGNGQGGGQHGSSTPGHSGDHNPHGGPPGHAGHHANGAAHQHASMHRHKH